MQFFNYTICSTQGSHGLKQLPPLEQRVGLGEVVVGWLAGGWWHGAWCMMGRYLVSTTDFWHICLLEPLRACATMDCAHRCGV